MKNTETYLAGVECSQVIILGDADIPNKDIIANMTADGTLMPTRNLPNILRNSNIKTHKNCASPKSHKMDTYYLLNTQPTNTSCELNETLSSTESEKEAYNKIALSKLHQRKQVHNPLNLQCDAPDWNNNKNKRSQTVGRVDTSHVLPKEENITTKKLKSSNKTKKHSHERKPKKIKTGETDIKTKVSNEKADFDCGLIAVPDINMNNELVLQNVDNFLSNDLTFSQTTYESNTSSCTSKNAVAAGSEELFNVSYCNNEARDFKRKIYDVNPVVSGGLTQFNSTQSKTLQNRFMNSEYSLIDDPEGVLMDGDIASNYLFKPEVLYTCTCMNCTAYEKDIIFYEEPASTFTSSDNSEAELYTSSLLDFYSDYYHIFGDILKDSSENLYCEEVEAVDIIRENAHVGNDGTPNVIENNMNALSVEDELQNAPPCDTNKVWDNDFETYSTEFIAHSNGPKRSSQFTENVSGLDETNCLNVESSWVDESKATLQNEAVPQDTASADVSNSEHEQQKKKKDSYVIQCAECGKLFHQKHQFRKHFTRCKFYKEDFKCQVCEKMYRYKSSLVQHLKKIHSLSYGPPEKFYNCSKCPKSYIRFRAFQRHILLHDD